MRVLGVCIVVSNSSGEDTASCPFAALTVHARHFWQVSATYRSLSSLFPEGQ